MTPRTRRVPYRDSPGEYVRPARLWAFAAVGIVAVGVILIMQRDELTPAEAIGLACAAIALVAAAALIPWRRLPRWTHLIIPLLAVALIAVGSELAGGMASGMWFLLLLPIIWKALYGTALEVAIVVAAAAVAVSVPLFVGGSGADGVSRALAFILVAVIVAVLLQRTRAVALVDPLTGLANRRAWDVDLGRHVEQVARTGRPVAVAVVDLDLFKAFNDTYGHLEGDALLREAAVAWREALRPYDTLARIGGEEFGVILPDTDEREAAAVIDRLRRATPRGQTCSAGIALITRDDDPVVVTRRADEALYQAKATGRNRAVIAPQMDDAAREASDEAMNGGPAAGR